VIPIGIQPISSEVPNEFELEQNYPNPFNPTTHFGFRIPDFGFVKITVYDVVGKLISTIVNEELKPGIYRLSWDGTGYSSGMYFYRLETENFVQTRKMVLIK
jgi:hypothetical protein